MTYQIGQIVPALGRTGIQGEEMEEPVWFALRARPKKETLAEAWLGKHHVEAWHPTETFWQKQPMGKPSVQKTRRIAPGYVLGRFTGEPMWHLMFGKEPGMFYLSSVLKRHGLPVPITDGELSEMATLPDRLRNWIEEAEKRDEEWKQRKAKEREVRPGDNVEILGGPMSGWVVEVADLSGNSAVFSVSLLGKESAKVPLDRVRKTKPLQSIPE